jgi:hypothetical protein
MHDHTLTPLQPQVAFGTASHVDTGQLLNRDGWMCHYCGRWLTLKNMTVDHVIPTLRGGPDTLDNTVICCLECNVRKSDMNGLEYRHWLAVRRYAFVIAPDEPLVYEPVEIVIGKGREQSSTVIALPALWADIGNLDEYRSVWEDNGGIMIRMSRQSEHMDIVFLAGVLYGYYAMKQAAR